MSIDLEGAVADAALMARVTVEFIGQALGFDALEPPKLTREACTQLTFMVLETCMKVEAARDSFYASLDERDHAERDHAD